ncbi:MAG: SGNH/GDSL hydrolase family protein [Bacteroidota bacterium]
MKPTLFLALPILIFLTAFTHPPVTWVAIGDSITYLNDHPDETGNRLTRGYMTQVTDQLPCIHYINQGHNGWTSEQIAASIEKLGLIKADVYTVFLGTNDWWHANRIGDWADYANNTGDSTIYGAFRIILDKLHQLNKEATIILITPMQRGDFVYINNANNNAYGSYKEKNGQTLEQVAEAIRTIGKHERIKVIDLYHNRQLGLSHMVKYKRVKDPQTGLYREYPYPDYIGITFNPASDEYPYPPGAMDVTFDGLHPSDKGDAIIAHQLVKALKKR